ncbi:MAG: hypothetical protein H8F28_05840, partial [Fibrella sp.]|nr:hypothetical protein [Armatimonadota bacterium]
MMNPRTRRILLGVVAFVAAILLARVACDLSRRAATQAVVNMVTQGEAGGRIPGDCPKCRRPYQLRVGQRLICPGCGTPLAACGQCGELIVGSATYRDRSDKIYLCAEHHADDKWVGERLAEYRAPAANTPPPNTAQAVAARAEYEKRLASCVERGVYPDKELFAEENAMSETALKTLPPGVNEAYQFYTRTV